MATRRRAWGFLEDPANGIKLIMKGGVVFKKSF
jgi:hypothetical protein